MDPAVDVLDQATCVADAAAQPCRAVRHRRLERAAVGRGLVRIFLTHHVTWSVNSVCHTFGSRPFPTRDRGRNHWLVGLLALGEGWHNHHHAFPRSALHGLRWWQADLSGFTIRLLARLRLAWDVQQVTAATMRVRVQSRRASVDEAA